MRVLGFGTYDVGRHPRVGILLTGLRELGVDVEELCEPLGLSTAERVAMLERPWLLHRLVTRLTARWARLSRGRGRVAAPDVVVVGYLGQLDALLARALFPRAVRVLDLLVLGGDTAVDRGAGHGLRARAAGALDSAAVRSADIVLVDTEEHAELVPAGRRRVVVAPVAAAPAWFAARPPSLVSPTDGPLRVVFFGLFTPLQGAPVLARALARLPDLLGAHLLEVTLVGTGQDYDETRAVVGALPHVTWLDWVDPAALPTLVAEHDVCLGIVGTTAKAQRVVPNKVYEGAAAGCAVLTSDTPPQRRALAGSAALVPPGDDVALAAALRLLVADRAEVTRLRQAAAARADAAFRPVDAARPLLTALTTASGGAR